MLLQIDANGDVFVVEQKNVKLVEDVKKDIHKIISIRQTILRLFLNDHLKYQELFDKTIAPELYEQKNTTSVEKLTEQFEEQVETIEYKNELDLYFIDKKLESPKKLIDIFGNNENTKVKIKLSKQFNEELEKYDKIYEFIDRNKFKEVSFFEAQKDLKVKESVDSETIVEKENLEIIGKSRIIVEKLKEEKLQLMILDIDQAKDREKALENAMKDPEFALFVSEVLYIIGERDLGNLEADMKFLKKLIKK
eukprot:gene4570-7954_t